MTDETPPGEKPYDPSPQKLAKAREKGEVVKSTDLFAASVYLGVLVAALTFGKGLSDVVANPLQGLIAQADRLAPIVFADGGANLTGGLLTSVVPGLLPLFGLPLLAVVAAIIAQRAFTVAPDKLKPKISRISLISNAKNKFGRNGLFEFAKSFVKLVAFSAALALFLQARFNDILGALQLNYAQSIPLLMQLMIQFMAIVFVLALAIGAVDYMWQWAQHRHKNRMTHKELKDEQKDSEGDPYMKQQRRQRAQEIASRQMLSDVETADVVIVNPTHFAVALKWSRMPGDAPECVAKGQDHIALRIREIATEHGVPIHSDPPTARALHATVEIGRQIPEEHYRAVAAAIRFAETMRAKARN